MFAGFHHFYRTVYVPDHAAELNRWVHLFSNVGAVFFGTVGVVTQTAWVFALGVWCQFGPPYLGHILFEKTHRSIDQSPIYAFIGSWYTTTKILLGRQCIRHPPAFAPEIPAHPPEHLLELVRQYGRNLHAFMVLEPGLQVWYAPDGQAAVAYTDRGGHWVAAGSPLCAAERVAEVTQAFLDAAEKASRTAVFFGVSHRFAERLGDLKVDVLPIGQAPIWDPREWTETVGRAKKLRNRLRRGHRLGLTARLADVDELGENQPLHRAMQALTADWTEAHALPPMGFLVTLELFQHPADRRYMVIEHAGTLAGFAVCVPVPGQAGWLVEDMMVACNAPAGTGETLVDGAMRQLASEGAAMVSLGLCVLAGLHTTPSDHPILMGILRTSGRAMGGLYNVDGLYRFRNKMRPARWQTVYLVSNRRMTIWTLRAVLMAFAEGWIPRFAMRVVGRWLNRHTIDGRTAALAAVGVGTVVACMVGVGLSILPWWLALPAATVACFIGFTPVHEAAHGHASTARVINNGIGHLCAGLVLGAFLPYRFLHGEHHRNNGLTVGDPDRCAVRGPSWTLPVRWATQDYAYLHAYAPHWRDRPLRERANLLICGAVYAGVLVGAALVGPMWLLAVVAAWFVPARLAQTALAIVFTWWPHADHGPRLARLRQLTRHSRALHWLWLGQNNHIAHHAHPERPFYDVDAASNPDRADCTDAKAITPTGVSRNGTAALSA
jgi:phosphatidylglycerol lysyltransferase